MYDDARIGRAFASLMSSVDVPAVPGAAIAARISAARASEKPSPPYARLGAAAAAAVLALALLPLHSAAVIQTVEMRFRDALHALGGQAPPPPPDALMSTLTPQTAAGVAAAQRRVDFTIAPPAGLPRDAGVPKLELLGTGAYSRNTGAWRKSAPAVLFAYRRSDGRTFDLLADRYDPREGRVGMYMFEALGTTRSGKPIIVRHEHFAWRNGDQVMSATVGNGISAREIDAIRVAMHGIALPRRPPHALGTPERGKIYVFSKP